MKQQFYPSPRSLGVRAVEKFKNTRVTRMLEPQAGRGDLADAAQEILGGRWGKIPIDTIEIDFENQAVLRQKKYRVVGHDFLVYEGASLYSHILMNPPFIEGVEHTLHAWNILYHGEIVSILNAESIRNPYTNERRLLANLIEQYGSVEYVCEAFMSPDTTRTTPVEVAIVHLEKVSQFKSEFLDNLKKDTKQESAESFQNPQELIVPNSKIDNLVTAFQLAVKAGKEAIFAEQRARYYAAMLGRSIADCSKKDDDDYLDILPCLKTGDSYCFHPGMG